VIIEEGNMNLEKLEIIDGYGEIEIKSWLEFVNYINKSDTKFNNILYNSNYIWRGQSNSTWTLTSSLDRKLLEIGRIKDLDVRNEHLLCFKMALRGRINEDISKLEENELWAIGQHYELKTPLLDWSKSPYIAAYFAFRNKRPTLTKAIYAINKEEIVRNDFEIECIEPLSNYNARLVNQSGVFIKLPQGTSLEEWVKCKFHGSNKPILVKFIITEIEPYTREVILTQLNRMNINALTLYPDLIGSSLFCNLKLEKNYY
jgi:hypothetical protein